MRLSSTTRKCVGADGRRACCCWSASALHILAAVQLWGQNRAARPVAYDKKADVPTSYAARTMRGAA